MVYLYELNYIENCHKDTLFLLESAENSNRFLKVHGSFSEVSHNFATFVLVINYRRVRALRIYKYFSTPLNRSLHNYSRENILLPIKRWIRRALWRVVIFVGLAFTLNFLYSYYFVTAKTYELRSENNELVDKYQNLLEQIANTKAELHQIYNHDNLHYRSMFSRDTLPWIFNQFTPQNIVHDSIGYGRYANLMRESQGEIDLLGWAIYQQSLSLDTMELSAKSKDKMRGALPTLWPMDRSLIRGHIGAFGMRHHPKSGRWKMHEGVDMAAAHGTPIYATANGVVVEAKSRRGYGYQVLIDHGFGYQTRYAHLSRMIAREGDVVRQGDKIGLMGNTGISVGTHLHYEVIVRGRPVNPMAYLSLEMTAQEFRDIIANTRETTYEKDSENE